MSWLFVSLIRLAGVLVVRRRFCCATFMGFGWIAGLGFLFCSCCWCSSCLFAPVVFFQFLYFLLLYWGSRAQFCFLVSLCSVSICVPMFQVCFVFLDVVGMCMVTIPVVAFVFLGVAVALLGLCSFCCSRDIVLSFSPVSIFRVIFGYVSGCFNSGAVFVTAILYGTFPLCTSVYGLFLHVF